ncbi:alpha/beta hydrolase [Nitrospira sp. MA-1]|nr:alpha/beta hydrolase [Nitrospira sp. MA-1]
MTRTQSHGLWFFVIFTAVMMTGCQSPVGVTRVDSETVRHQLTKNAISSGETSPYTENVLRVTDLTEAYFDDPREALNTLHHIFLAEEQRKAPVAFALAELSFLYAQKTNQPSYYLAAALYAYLYLFSENSSNHFNPFDPRVRIAADLYNRSLTSGFISKERSVMILQSGSYALPFGTLQVALPENRLQWENRTLTNFIPVAELEVRGLHNRYRQAGIGVPLAADQIPLGQEEGLQIAKGKMPVTAFMRLPNLMEQLKKGTIQGDWEVYNAYDRRTISIQESDVPLEIEFTSSLAASLADDRVWARELKGFFMGDSLAGESGELIALEPYRPGRIPVVFVHGTASGSGRWADMTNDLMADPSVRDRFQFWFFTYDTGNPILYSAALLRETLQTTVNDLERKYQDPALQAMVVIGHSQGGLLSRLTAVETGNIFWDEVSNQPLDDMKVSNQTRDLLQRMLFITPLPTVNRLIFIATPHHGSYVAGSWGAHQLAKFVKLPGRLMSGVTDLLSLKLDTLKLDLQGMNVGSVSAMEPGSPLAKGLAQTPLAPGVSGHSIIAVEGDGPVEDGNDGVVAYQSAHLEGMESEFVVRSGHSCQSNTHTIQEVRRILLLHAQERCETHSVCH